MKAIDADILKDNVLKWLPSDPCGNPDKEHPFQEDICVSMLMEIEEQPTHNVNWIFVADDVPDTNGWYMVIVWDTFTGIHPCPAFYRVGSNVWNRANVILWYPHTEPSHEEIEKWWDGSGLEKDLRKMLGYGY